MAGGRSRPRSPAPAGTAVPTWSASRRDWGHDHASGKMGTPVKEHHRVSRGQTSVFALPSRDRRSLIPRTLERVAAHCPAESGVESRTWLTSRALERRTRLMTVKSGPPYRRNQDQPGRTRPPRGPPGGRGTRRPMVAEAGRSVYRRPRKSGAGLPRDGVTGHGAQGRTAGPAGDRPRWPGHSASCAGWRESGSASHRPPWATAVGEIAGLVWAWGSLARAGAARVRSLQYGEVRRGLAAARSRWSGSPRRGDSHQLRPACGLTVAADEGPRSHVLAGPVPGVRELAQQAVALGITATVLDVAHALHTRLMTPCAAPLRSVLAQVPFGRLRRRLLSTVNRARSSTGQDGIAAVLALSSDRRCDSAERAPGGGRSRADLTCS